jgi:hypothetical protein
MNANQLKIGTLTPVTGRLDHLKKQTGVKTKDCPDEQWRRLVAKRGRDALVARKTRPPV